MIMIYVTRLQERKYLNLRGLPNHKTDISDNDDVVKAIFVINSCQKLSPVKTQSTSSTIENQVDKK